MSGAKALSCSVLVVSCDRYSDLWKPFFHLFSRYWPDCPYPVYLGSNFKRSDATGVTTLLAGEDRAWGMNLRLFLESVPSEYVLLMLEDFFLDETVDTAAVERSLRDLDSLNGTTLRLFPNPPCDYVSEQPNIGIVDRRAGYRVSMQAALWNKAKLAALIRDQESTWEFEWNATERSRADATGYYCVLQGVIHYQHVVERGEWFRSSARRYGAEDIGCDFAARPVMTTGRALKKQVSNFFRRALSRCQSKWLSWQRQEVELRAR